MAKVLSERASVHPEAEVRDDVILGRWTEVGARTRLADMTLGDYSYIVQDCDVISTTIGKFCSIAAVVRINPGNHPMWRAAQHHFSYRAAQYGFGEDEPGFFEWRREHWVEIGHDVWIGHGAIVLPGVSVGTGAVIAAGAVVSKPVEPYTIVAGVPARAVRRRFAPDVAERMMRLAWWDWEHERIGTALEDFRELSVEAFLDKHERV